MNIAENILKHSLQNVYFLAGTTLAGKTTMAKILVEKHGFTFFSEDWYTDSFNEFRSICNAKYQPLFAAKKTMTQADREVHYSRSVEEFLADDEANRGARSANDEYVEFAIIELIKMSQHAKVITDVLVPIPLLAEISDYNRIACMIAAPELLTCENYGKRESHKAFLDMLLSLDEPEKKIAVQNELFKIGAKKISDEVRGHNLFGIVRDENSTIEHTLKILEKHFMLVDLEVGQTC